MGEIITFYSYKGGVGRTMALANVAVLLAKWGFRVLIVDWDLEAPGLEFYFKSFIDPENISDKNGIVDLLHALKGAKAKVETLDWDSFTTSIRIDRESTLIDLITSGKQNEHYFNKVRNLDLDEFYLLQEGGIHIEKLRYEWKKKYDYVLIDSRTGVTDIGGICTVQLPDFLVALFTANEQSFQGIINVSEKIRVSQQGLPLERLPTTILPVPSRFDTTEEYKISQEWLNRFSEGLDDIYKDWLPKNTDKKDFLENTKIPYIAYFSFGENLPVLEHGTVDPTSLGYAYETLASLLATKLESVQEVIKNKKDVIREIKQKKISSLKPIFVNRVAELDLLMNSLSSPTGDRFFVLLSAPGMGKTRLLEELRRRTESIGEWEISQIDLSSRKNDVQYGALDLFAESFNLEFNNLDQEQLSREVTRTISKRNRPHLLLLDQAELLSEITAKEIRDILSRINNSIEKSGGHIKLVFVAASRSEIKSWIGIIPAPRFRTLVLSHFDENVITHLLDMEIQAYGARNLNKNWHTRMSEELYRATEGIPFLLTLYLEHIKNRAFTTRTEEIMSEKLFDQLAAPYIDETFLSGNNFLAPNLEHDVDHEILVYMLLGLSVFRFISESHVERVFEQVDDRKRNVRDIWNVFLQSNLMRPSRTILREIYPSIRRLLFRYQYRGKKQQINAHERAYHFMSDWWTTVLGTDRVLYLIESLWHFVEKTRLSNSKKTQKSMEILEYVRFVFTKALHPNRNTVGDISSFALSRMEDDTELQKSMSEIDIKLFENVIKLIGDLNTTK